MVKIMSQEETDVYYIAKAIAEEFDYQINYQLSDRQAELRENGNSDALLTVCDTIVTFNEKTRNIEIETLYFNEFDDNQVKYSCFGAFKNRHCRNVTDFSKVIGMYFKYFFKDFDCCFTINESQ